MKHSKFRRVVSHPPQASHPTASREAQFVGPAAHAAETLGEQSLPKMLSWLQRYRPDAASVIAATPLDGIAEVSANGAAAKASVSLVDLIKKPGRYRTATPTLLQQSIGRLAQSVAAMGAGNVIMLGISRLLSGIEVAGQIAKIAPPLILSAQAYGEMPTPSADQMARSMGALTTDPAMSTATPSAQAITGSGIGGGSLPVAWMGGSMITVPSYVTSPHVYSADPIKASDNIAGLVSSPSGYNFDSTGYIQSPGRDT